MKSQNFFGEIFFDILTFVIPGGLIALTFFNYFWLTGKSDDLRFLELFSKQAMKDYSWLTWVILTVFAYLIGMVVSSLMDRLKEIFYKSLSCSYRIIEFLKESEKFRSTSERISPIEGIKNKVINEINRCFDLDPGMQQWNEFLIQNHSVIFQLIRNFVEARSALLRPIPRYYERLALVRNFVFATIFISINFLWLLPGETISAKIGFVAGAAVFGILAFIYTKGQSRQYVETVLMRFYTIRLVEKSESMRFEENRLLRDRLEQVEREVKKQRSGTDVLSQLARQFMKQAPPGDNE